MDNQSTGSKVMAAYKGYTDEDKAALRALQSETQTKLGIPEIKISDMLAAVTPGIETPAFLKAA